jgi:hypothetical protein
MKLIMSQHFENVSTSVKSYPRIFNLTNKKSIILSYIHFLYIKIT